MYKHGEDCPGMLFGFFPYLIPLVPYAPHIESHNEKYTYEIKCVYIINSLGMHFLRLSNYKSPNLPQKIINFISIKFLMIRL